MARRRDFDLEAALDRAVVIFWERGFAATSVRDLCEAMDIGAGSFYAAFGSKSECFRRALDRYLVTQGTPREPSCEAIALWLEAIVDPCRTPSGCLLVDSAVEHPLLEPAAQEKVSGHLDGMEAFFRRALASRGACARDDAALLAGAVVAIHVLARTGAAPARLRRLANRALDAVGLPPLRRRRRPLSVS